MKLELKHLSPYLPYNLNVLSGDSKEIYQLVGLHVNWQENFNTYDRKIKLSNGEERKYSQNLKYCKPILRPLSFLKTEIEINGKIILPIDILGYETDGWQTRFFIIETETRKFKDVQKLFEWHFDVFGLIEKGLAVDYMSVFNKP